MLIPVFALGRAQAHSAHHARTYVRTHACTSRALTHALAHTHLHTHLHMHLHLHLHTRLHTHGTARHGTHARTHARMAAQTVLVCPSCNEGHVGRGSKYVRFGAGQIYSDTWQYHCHGWQASVGPRAPQCLPRSSWWQVCQQSAQPCRVQDDWHARTHACTHARTHACMQSFVLWAGLKNSSSSTRTHPLRQK